MSVDSIDVSGRLLALAARGELSHAYLIEGPSGSGKSALALLLVQALFCEEPKDGAPCGECRICRQLAAGSYPDLYRFPEELEQIPAAEVRELREWLYQSPLSGSRKAAIIDEASRLSRISQNTLLKVLEEPPEGTLILITDSSRAAIDTIRSRAQRVWLGGEAEDSSESSEWSGLVAELPDLTIPRIFTDAEEIATLSHAEVKTLVEAWINRLREGLPEQANEQKIRRLLKLHRALSTNAATRLQLEAALLELKLIAN
jgi:DNA polymerase-3 subunit delta'